MKPPQFPPILRQTREGYISTHQRKLKDSLTESWEGQITSRRERGTSLREWTGNWKMRSHECSRKQFDLTNCGWRTHLPHLLPNCSTFSNSRTESCRGKSLRYLVPQGPCVQPEVETNRIVSIHLPETDWNRLVESTLFWVRVLTEF